jgi:NADPH-dependent curcumin reductase CurA
MTVRENRRIVLAARPTAAATAGAFRLERGPVPAPAAGEVLIRNLWLSLDPYMRGRMSDAPSYVPPVAVGAPMVGGTVARVEESRDPRFRAGDLVVAMGGWQDYAIAAGDDLRKLPAGFEHPSYALGVLGMPGFTAYMGLLEIGRPRAGETVVVGAATGAVGSVVGQLAKREGCRVVGIAGGADKCRWAVEGLRFDACVDHRDPAFPERLAAACPGGIDVYFENVGGAVLRAVLPLLNTQARVPVCGLIAHYQGEAQALGADFAPALLRAILVKRLTIRGFIVFDFYGPRFEEFLERASGWLRDGSLTYREDVVDGLEHAPEAFVGLLAGRNFGKLVVKIAD